MKTRCIVLNSRPHGVPTEDNFRLVEQELPTCGPDQVRVQTHYLSVDPYMRGRMRDARSYADPVQVGEVMVGGGAGTVQESNHPRFQVGDAVVGQWGWREQAVVSGDEIHRFKTQLAPLSTSLGVLGMPGMTAYFGLFDVGQPKAGETVFVTGAAGAVGSTVAQLANQHGCIVAGSAGSAEKIRYLAELGVRSGFNYKEAKDLSAAVDAACPDGVDVFFDNVGGPLSDAVFEHLNVGARVVICGQIDQYNDTDAPQGPRLLWRLIVARARVQGFLVFDYQDRYAEAFAELASRIQSGDLQYRETIVEGFENTPRAFIGLFKGENIGKQLVKVSDPAED